MLSNAARAAGFESSPPCDELECASAPALRTGVGTFFALPALMRHRRPPRLASFSYVGRHRYFFTMCTLRRQPSFIRADIVHIVRTQLLRTSADLGFEVLAYTFMPDHVHGLVESVRDDCDFVEFVRRLRRRTSAESWQLLKAGLWQDGWHERVLRGAEGTDEVIDYILLNPVRAGLVEKAADHPYSWSIRT